MDTPRCTCFPLQINFHFRSAILKKKKESSLPHTMQLKETNKIALTLPCMALSAVDTKTTDTYSKRLDCKVFSTD